MPGGWRTESSAIGRAATVATTPAPARSRSVPGGRGSEDAGGRVVLPPWNIQ